MPTTNEQPRSILELALPHYQKIEFDKLHTVYQKIDKNQYMSIKQGKDCYILELSVFESIETCGASFPDLKYQSNEQEFEAAKARCIEFLKQMES